MPFLIKMIHVVVTKATIVMIKAAARELIDMMQTLSVSEQCVITVCEGLVDTDPVAFIVGQKVPRNRVLKLLPQTTVCTVNVQSLPLFGTSVQVASLSFVVLRQLPQFDVLIW